MDMDTSGATLTDEAKAFLMEDFAARACVTFPAGFDIERICTSISAVLKARGITNHHIDLAEFARACTKARKGAGNGY
ncbi:hypothetical protein B0G69_0110 [Paraburkholderia sp. RAU2J]|uniref:hypothetical protein n=1 Tax=Paraburkholderia sp. RAU2J TaxID=1938810 RepID=UPI000F0F3383|nr:hypothetical protein [Paraburkholderia sp. RAU2J]RKT24443.1 hypothetical protein B0G69_0110 [Paraburkholderia sp. RAU2J]